MTRLNARSMRSILAPLALLALLPLMAGCDALFGSKQDDVTRQIFDEGQIDPTLVDDVGYVALNPFFTRAATGEFDEPRDVYVGFDEFVYVVDNNGLHLLDLAGRPLRSITSIGNQPLRGAVSVRQDRRLHLYVAARRDTLIGTTTWDLPVVYRLSGITAGGLTVEDIIWHPFDDRSRQISFRQPQVFSGPNCRAHSDSDASFTGIAVLRDNRVYISRKGPGNAAADCKPSFVAPQNSILVFTPDGRNTQQIGVLSATAPSLRSAFYPQDVLSFVHPPQRASLPANDDFLIAQAPPGEPLQFGVLSIRVVETIEGTDYRVDSEKLNVAAEPTNGDGFLYDQYKFRKPSGMAYAADGTNYIFVVDSGSDSLYVFNRQGIEGVAPPPGSGSTRPVRVSFGGRGSGALQLSRPEGVAYFNRIVYVADTGNNRITRYRLNTDFE